MIQENTVFFDLETQNTFKEINTRNPADLKIAVAGTLCNNKYTLFEESETDNLIKILNESDIIVGHNLFGFDYQVLSYYTDQDLFETLRPKTLDMMRELAGLLGSRTKWVSLDDLAKRNCGVSKSENGAIIPKMWRDGKQAEVKAYLVNDLKLTESVYNQAIKNKKLKYEHVEYNISYGEREIKVNW